MTSFSTLPLEIRRQIYELSVNAQSTPLSPFAAQAKILARGLLPLVNPDFAKIDQHAILNQYTETAFEHTKNAIGNFAKQCQENDTGNSQFSKYVTELLRKNKFLEVDFSTMSENQGKLFLDALNAIASEQSTLDSNLFSVIKKLKITAAKSLPNLGKLTHLNSLTISNCDQLTSLDQLTALVHLDIYECENLNSLPSLDDLNALESLEISDCNRLRYLPSLNQLTKLKHLTLYNCEKLGSLPSLDKLEVLTFLEITFCPLLKALPSLDKLTTLETLRLIRLNELTSLPSLNNLTALKSLEIFLCNELDALPDLDQLIQLNTLIIADCDELITLPALEKLIQLNSLAILYCNKLSEVPDLTLLNALKFLRIDPQFPQPTLTTLMQAKPPSGFNPSAPLLSNYHSILGMQAKHS